MQRKKERRDNLRVSAGLPYVSRGGVKLAGALEAFRLDPRGATVLDVGASTGGFTDCLLQKGAKKVYAVDVAYGHLAWRLRKDPRVTCVERTNIRYLAREAIPEEIDLATVDVSFISLKKVLPRVMEFVKSGGDIVALVKPQFEAQRKEVGRGGIVRDPTVHHKVLLEIRQYAEEAGLHICAVSPSCLPGAKGNIEYFLHLRKPHE